MCDDKEHAALLLSISRASRVESRFYGTATTPVSVTRQTKRKHSAIADVKPFHQPGNILAPEKPEKPLKVVKRLKVLGTDEAKELNRSKEMKAMKEKETNPTIKDHLLLPIKTVIGCRYEVQEERGAGAYGCVYACLDHTPNRSGDPLWVKKMVAVKVFKNSDFFRLSARNEVNFLKLLTCVKVEGVINLLDHFVHDVENQSYSCIVTELCETSLYDQLQTTFKTGFPMQMVRNFGKQILLAITQLHANGVVHSDLKPDNIGLIGENIKLLDFGSCKLLSKKYLYAQTLRYRAPEVLLGLPSSSPIDLWAIGCTLVELFTGKCLFRSEVKSVDEKRRNADQLFKIMKTLGPVPESMMDVLPLKMTTEATTISLTHPLPLRDPKFKSLILGLLEYNPAKRLSAKEALNHPFFL